MSDTEIRRSQHPCQPPRELALQLSVSYAAPHEPADMIVNRAEAYLAFLTGS